MNERDIQIDAEPIKMRVSLKENYLPRQTMFSVVREKVTWDDPCKLFVFFDMGSVILDTGDPMNHIIVHDDFVEIYNNDQMETTFIRTDKINGFLFEPKKEELTLDDLEEEEVL